MNNQDELQDAGYYDGLSAVPRYIRMYYDRLRLLTEPAFS